MENPESYEILQTRFPGLESYDFCLGHEKSWKMRTTIYMGQFTVSKMETNSTQFTYRKPDSHEIRVVGKYYKYLYILKTTYLFYIVN